MARPFPDSGAEILLAATSNITRGDIEDWLIEKARIEATQQAATLRWAMIAGWAGIISAILTAAGIAIGFWMAK